MCVQIESGRQMPYIIADLTEEADAEMMSLSSQLLQEKTRRHAAEKKFKRLQVGQCSC